MKTIKFANARSVKRSSHLSTRRLEPLSVAKKVYIGTTLAVVVKCRDDLYPNIRWGEGLRWNAGLARHVGIYYVINSKPQSSRSPLHHISAVLRKIFHHQRVNSVIVFLGD